MPGVNLSGGERVIELRRDYRTEAYKCTFVLTRTVFIFAHAGICNYLYIHYIRIYIYIYSVY